MARALKVRVDLGSRWAYMTLDEYRKHIFAENVGLADWFDAVLRLNRAPVASIYESLPPNST